MCRTGSRLNGNELVDRNIDSLVVQATFTSSGILTRMFLGSDLDHEALGLARLQNDLLLALTARHTGTLFVTGDAHFTALRGYIPFTLKVLPH